MGNGEWGTSYLVCVQLLVAADQLLLEPMKRKCEKVLSEKVDAEVAVPMYQAAHHYSAPQLLACSSHYLLLHYKEIRDPGTVPLY